MKMMSCGRNKEIVTNSGGRTLRAWSNCDNGLLPKL